MTYRQGLGLLKRFGLLGTLQLLTSRRRLRHVLPEWTTRLMVNGYRFPFHFRHATTDKYVICEVLGYEQYSALQGMQNVRTIVDAGANIGTTSAYLLNAYPTARVLSIEPDPGNFAVLQRNLSYYGDRASALQRALWNRNEPLAISRHTFRDGGEWSFQVQAPSSAQDVEVEGITITQLLAAYDVDVIDILKIDIEGAERIVFEDLDLSWLARVRVIAIELHDSLSQQAFRNAIAPSGAETHQFGEVTIWRNPSFARESRLSAFSS